MTGSDEQDVYGCCKCLYMVCEELPHSDAYSLLPTIAPTIFTIVSNNNVRWALTGRCMLHDPYKSKVVFS